MQNNARLFVCLTPNRLCHSTRPVCSHMGPTLDARLPQQNGVKFGLNSFTLIPAFSFILSSTFYSICVKPTGNGEHGVNTVRSWLTPSQSLLHTRGLAKFKRSSPTPAVRVNRGVVSHAGILGIPRGHWEGHAHTIPLSNLLCAKMHARKPSSQTGSVSARLNAYSRESSKRSTSALYVQSDK